MTHGGGASLAIVGTGYRDAAHLTPEALAHIDGADRLFTLGSRVAQETWLRARNATLEDLHHLYRAGRPRRLTYAAMARRLLAPLPRGRRVCAAFYGHPGVFVAPSHEAIRRARAAGFPAVMYPAVSAEDCLFADLGVDPAHRGCQSYEATSFLERAPRFSTSSALVLWQVGAIGVRTYETSPLWSRSGLKRLARTLLRYYPPGHEVVVYVASTYSVCGPSIARVPLERLGSADVTVESTLYVPPLGAALPDPIASQPARHRGRLTLVGTGYRGAGQITTEAEAWIRHADVVLYLERERVTAAYLEQLNPRARSLAGCLGGGRSAAQANAAMVGRILAQLRAGREVCVAFYGHPAVGEPAAHEAVRRARALGCDARMLPGISITDCLYADLGLDPARRGCQLYDARDFLSRSPVIETATPLILLGTGASRGGLAALVERLQALYPPGHVVTQYQIPRRPTAEARIRAVPLRALAAARPAPFATLLVPAAEMPLDAGRRSSE